MAEIYSAPEGVEVPQIKHPYNHEEYEKDSERYVEAVKKFAKENGSGKYSGEVISFPVADGYARYVVFSLKPVRLIHLADGDAWQMQYDQNLTAKDIREKVQQQKKMSELFKCLQKQ